MVLPLCYSLLFLQTNAGIRKSLEQEIIHYEFKTSFFDIFVSGAGPQPRGMEGQGLTLLSATHDPIHWETQLSSRETQV